MFSCVYRPRTWNLSFNVRVNNTSGTSSSLWRARTSAPDVDLLPWLTVVQPTLGDRDPAQTGNPDHWKVEVAAPTTWESRSSDNVGGVDVDLLHGTFLRPHAVLLDASGGASELAVPGIVYDSATVHRNNSGEPILETVIRKLGGPDPSSISAELVWDPSSPNSQTVPAQSIVRSGGDAYVATFQLPIAPTRTGLYGWQVNTELVFGQEPPVKLVDSGELPVVVNGEDSLFGLGCVLCQRFFPRDFWREFDPFSGRPAC